MRSGDAADGDRAARRVGLRVTVVPEVDLHVVDSQAESFGKGDRDHGAGAGAQVLAAQEGFDRPVGMHFDGAGRGPGTAAPAVQGHAQPSLDRLSSALAMGVPLGLPVDQLRTDLHLLGVDIRLGRLVEVLHEDVVAVGSHLRRQVVDHRVGDRTQLRVRGSSPGPVRPGVGRDARRLAVAVGDPVEAVGELPERNRRAGNPAGAPVVAVPDSDVAFGIGRDRDFGEPARTGSPDLQLGGPVEHQPDRFAGLLGQLGTGHTPFIGRELRPEPATDVVAGDRDVAGVDSQRAGELAAGARDVLGREGDIELVLTIPLAV